MKTTKALTLIIGTVAILGILSLLNNTFLNNITGNTVLSLSEEFNGMSILFVIVFCVIGLYTIRNYHQGEKDLSKAVEKVVKKDIKSDINKIKKKVLK